MTVEVSSVRESFSVQITCISGYKFHVLWLWKKSPILIVPSFDSILSNSFWIVVSPGLAC